MTLRSCQSQGFEPRVAHRVDDFATVLSLVAAGAGVALVPQLALTDIPAGVVLTALPIGRRTRIAYRHGSRSSPPRCNTRPGISTVRHRRDPARGRPEPRHAVVHLFPGSRHL
jgi:DNA-binding transcriptional LysR family regulator